MTAYIKLSTKEYPRHIGDIELDPVGIQDYSLVSWTDKPYYDSLIQVCYETFPIEVNGEWKMQWLVRDMTQDELQRLAEINSQILTT